MSEHQHAEQTPARSDAIDQALVDLEAGVKAMSDALRGGDPQLLEFAAAQLNASLMPALGQLRQAAAPGHASSSAVRRRLAFAAAEVSAQREAVARAAAALERTAAVLWPGGAHAYDATGIGARTLSTGSLVA